MSASHFPRLIGGLFGLECPDQADRALPASLRADDHFTVNARSALIVLLERLAPRRLWLPAYLCPVLVTSTRGRWPIAFYDGLPGRSTPHTSLPDLVRADDAVVVIDYFGFPPCGEIVEQTRARGATLIEDACQALWSEGVGEQADYVLFSPRKFLGVVDGGVLGVRRGKPLVGVTLEPPPGDWWNLARAAAVGRAAFDRDESDSRAWFPQFQQAERDQPCGAFAMSLESRAVLEQPQRQRLATQRRRDNFFLLAESLGDMALFPSLPGGVVPLGFPIRVANRDALQRRLFAAEMYPPVHWNLAGDVPVEFEAAHAWSRELLTLPCDQRYDAESMRQIAMLVRAEGVPCRAT